MENYIFVSITYTYMYAYKLYIYVCANDVISINFYFSIMRDGSFPNDATHYSAAKTKTFSICERH